MVTKSKGIRGYVKQFNGVKRLCGDYKLLIEKVSYLVSYVKCPWLSKLRLNTSASLNSLIGVTVIQPFY